MKPARPNHIRYSVCTRLKGGALLKKLILRILSFSLAVCAVFSFTACGSGNREGVLYLSAFEGGYGNTYLDALCEAYKQYNPNFEYEVTCNPLVSDKAQTALEANSSDQDIYFIDGLNFCYMTESYEALYPLDELYNSYPKAGDNVEDTLIKDKLIEKVVSTQQYTADNPDYNGHYYAISFAAGPNSLLLNRTALNNVLGEGKWREPRTTDELLELCAAIVAAEKTVNVAGTQYDVYPFIYAGNAVEYWRYMYYVWQAQYDGIDGWNDYLTCRLNGEYNPEAIAQEGRYKALAVMEEILKRDNGYCEPSSTSNAHTTTQMWFLQGRACMMVCGDWFEREMANSSYEADIVMIKTPVLSDLGEVFGGTEAENEKTLRTVVAAIDSGETEAANVDGDDFESIAEARKMVFSLTNNQIAVIPSTSANKELAIDFLRFLYSDEGAAVMFENTGSYVPIKDYYCGDEVYAELSDFKKSALDIIKDCTYVLITRQDPIQFRAGLPEWLRSEKPEISMGKKNNAVSSKKIIDDELVTLKQQWNNYMLHCQ